MKRYIRGNLINLPRSFRVWYGRQFMYMLGKLGTHEFNDDIILYNELERWVRTNGKPTTPYIKENEPRVFGTADDVSFWNSKPANQEQIKREE